MNSKGILLVDDEAKAVKYFARAFGARFSVFSATSAEEALRVLADHHEEIGVIVTDQRMPESSGVELLKTVREQYPHTVRILTTAYSDLDTLIEAINTGSVYSFVAKPWELGDLEKTLRSALEQHDRTSGAAHILELKVDELRARILEDRTYDVGLISAKIGHYVHNALCPVTLLIDHLLDHAGSSSGLSTEFLQHLRKHIYEVAGTLKDLAEITVPPTRASYQSVDLQQLLNRALSATEVLREEKRLSLKEVTIEDLPTIEAVPEQIERLFRFMIAEELVSLPSGSEVRVRLSKHVADGDLLGVNIEFEDFVPVAPNVDPNSFLHPFNLRGRNPREFGVFLVSSYFIARHHGGSLTARVKPDNGLLFSFFLPYSSQGIIADPSYPEPAGTSKRSKK